MSIQCDLAVIGAGPGGYVGALRAAQLGARVVVVEKDRVGGVCLNWGCIPTKALLRTAEVLALTRQATDFGIAVTDIRLDWAAAQKRKDAIVRRLTAGVKLLLERAGVRLVAGTAHFVAPFALEVVAPDGVERVEAKDYIIATGSRPASIPIPGLEGAGILTSDAALSLQSLPASMLIIGGGPIGVEFATLFRACGAQVTLVEVLPRVLPALDAELGAEVERALKKARVRVHTASKVTLVEPHDGRYLVTIQTDSQDIAAEVDTVLLAVGRHPNVEGLGLAVAGIEAERAGIPVDPRMQTIAPHVYAVGDVTGGMLLAHVAMQEGIVAAENALGGLKTMNYRAVPSCVLSWPEVAAVGLTEDEARQQGHDVQVGRFPFRANGKALALGEHDGLVKIVAESKHGRVLGVHIVGPHASDLIQEGTLAIMLESTLDELVATIHPHPTLSEAIAEAGLAANGCALHV